MDRGDNMHDVTDEAVGGYSDLCEELSSVEICQEEGEKVKGRKKTRRSRKKKGGKPAQFNVDSYVMKVCKQLTDKRMFLVYTAIDHLGYAVFNELVERVNAIQAEGGLKTKAGDRLRSGGSILWSLLEKENPDAFRHVFGRFQQLKKRCEEVGKNPEG